jgi:primosomal protein N' (replication factor Y)
MSANLVLHIAVPTPLRRLFDYLPPVQMSEQQRETLMPGMRFEVPFGARTVIGVLIALDSRSDFDKDKLKPASALLDENPILPTTLIALIAWAAAYYHHSPGECWHAILPALLRKGEALKASQQRYLQLSRWGKGLPEKALERAKKQQHLLQLLQQHERMTVAEIEAAGSNRAAIKALLDKNLIEELLLENTTPQARPGLKEASLLLNHEQQQAKSAICDRLDTFSVFLLEGITGSGKTEVYLQVIDEVLKKGRQALVLVPEIGLTPQTVARFRKRFKTDVAALHSGLNDRERLDSWLQSARNQAGIIIGTRSAIFVPMAAPGIIIIDEEHDLSFKQQTGFRYSARDVAVMRGQYENIPVILGSATPSIESLYNAQYRRYEHLQMTRRAGKAQAPDFLLIDTRNKPLNEGLSEELIAAISDTLHQHQQALIFLNRRGFAPTLMCHDCGWIAECTHCELRMTVHLYPPHLHCHHCDQKKAQPKQCPQCKSETLKQLGMGTERSELILQQLFPTTPLYRIDRDTTQRKNAMQDMVNDINQGGAALLVGTQMLAKGHHFPHVTLVAILDADAGLFGSDFRAPEKMGQLLIQVAGRAGREEKPGKVYIQTRFPEHPLITTLISRGYHPFAQDLLAERHQLGLPPCAYMALLRCEHANPRQAESFLLEIRRFVEPLLPHLQTPLQIIGPLPAPIAKKSGRYRFQLLFTARQRQKIQTLLGQLLTHIEQLPTARKVRWSIDVDPLDMS